MAIIKQGILGGFSGSVAGVVGTSWKGRAVMKSKPLSVANPKTESQQAQRMSFKSIAVLASVLLTAICRTLYNPIAGNISGYNKFTQQNKTAFDSSGVFVPANCKIGGGTLIHDQITTGTTTDSGASLTVEWVDSSAAASVRKNDIAYMFAIEPISGNVWSSNGESVRSEETADMQLLKAGSDLMGQLQIAFYIGYTSPDGRLVSVEASGVELSVDFGS